MVLKEQRVECMKLGEAARHVGHIGHEPHGVAVVGDQHEPHIGGEEHVVGQEDGSIGSSSSWITELPSEQDSKSIMASTLKGSVTPLGGISESSLFARSLSKAASRAGMMSFLTCSAHDEAKALALSRSAVDESCISVRASDKEELMAERAR
eukprot:4608712-Alexandrium_andersonii.AAC.1